MRPREALPAIVAVLVALAPVAACKPPAVSGSREDTRQRLVLPAEGRDKVLAEMRGMLVSMDGILKALSAGDLPAAEKSARASGLAVAADVEPEIRKALPEAFLSLGTQTHGGFDRLADRIRGGAGKTEVLKDLSDITSRCVACHAAYRLDEAR